MPFQTPVIVNCSAQLQVIIGSFLADFILSQEFQTKHGRAAKVYDDMPTPAEAFHALRLPEELVCTAAQIDPLNLVSAASVHVKKLMVTDNVCQLWGMAPNKFWIGTEQYGFGAVRLQCQGFRHCIAFSAVATREQVLPTATDKDIKDLVENGTKKNITSIEEALGDQIWAGTLGPNDLVAMPPGFILAERTLSASSYGMKRYIFPKDPEPLKRFNEMRAPKSSTAEVIVDVMTKLKGE